MLLEDVLPALRAGEKIGNFGQLDDIKLLKDRNGYYQIGVWGRDKHNVYCRLKSKGGFTLAELLRTDWEVRE